LKGARSRNTENLKGEPKGRIQDRGRDEKKTQKAPPGMRNIYLTKVYFGKQSEEKERNMRKT